MKEEAVDFRVNVFLTVFFYLIAMHLVIYGNQFHIAGAILEGGLLSVVGMFFNLKLEDILKKEKTKIQIT